MNDSKSCSNCNKNNTKEKFLSKKRKFKNKLTYNFSKNIENNHCPENIHYLNDLIKIPTCTEIIDFCINILYGDNIEFSDYMESIHILCIFQSVDNIFCLVYSNICSIISYNITDNVKINEIKNAHNLYIENLRYFCDKQNNRDLIISLSCNESDIKLWNINTLECLLFLENIYKVGKILSACYINVNGEFYIITSNNTYNYISFFKDSSIKVYDLEGNFIKVLNDSCDRTYFIDSFYDYKFDKNYIISCNKNDIKSFDFCENKLYHKYYISNISNYSRGIIYFDENKKVKMIFLYCDKTIRIWDFHLNIIIITIVVSEQLNSICLWNNNYLFGGTNNGIIKIIKIKEKEIIKSFEAYKNDRTYINKIIHPKFGECLITQSRNGGLIKLWVNTK